jgi:hypothetical protein
MTAATVTTVPDDSLAARQAAHWDEAKAAAERNLARVNADPGREDYRRRQEALRLRMSKPGQTTPARLALLLEMGQNFNDRMKPYSACRAGCSFCCHAAVPISRSEAELLAQVSGRRLHRPRVLREARYQIEPAPCPFLAAGRCTVYAARPMTCRTLLNMDDIPLQCEIVPGSPAQVPYVNPTQFYALYGVVTRQQPHADIRDWFRNDP